MNTLKEKITAGRLSLAGLLILLATLVLPSAPIKLGSAPSGLQGNVASSTIPLAVGPQEVKTVFSVSGQCNARIISTAGQPIMLSFATSSSAALRNKPTATYGLQQAASTTVNYDSGVYGCSEVTAYGANASTTITIIELN